MVTTSTVPSQRKGEAGRRGEGIRSDLAVTLEIRGQGSLEINITSKVEVYYGEAIRQQVLAILNQLKVEHARVTLEDAGALPFVIAARVEAAAHLAGVDTRRPRRSARKDSVPPASRRDRLRRSRLYLPGNEPKFMVNAGLHDSDAIILDLEDSVHADRKVEARYLVAHALRSLDFRQSERMVRINQLPLGLQDLEVILPEQPDLILIPKVEEAGQVLEVDRAVEEKLKASGSQRAIWLMPILESARGIENATEIADASNRVAALTLGLEDYTADLGVVKTSTGEETLYARHRVVNAAKAAGVQAIDSVYGDVADEGGLASWASRSCQLGFEGMGCLHPRQIPVIHRAYAPRPEEIKQALRIEAAFLDAQARGLGVVSLGSKMIDPPVVARARKLVERARAMGLIGDGSQSEKGES